MSFLASGKCIAFFVNDSHSIQYKVISIVSSSYTLENDDDVLLNDDEINKWHVCIRQRVFFRLVKKIDAFFVVFVAFEICFFRFQNSPQSCKFIS